LDSCPPHMFADLGACVSTCGAGRTDINGTCQPCDGACPRGRFLHIVRFVQ
jgi:hypothetical protein